MFSILLLTLNEERNLPGFLACVGPDIEVVLLDSGSTDHTVAHAKAAGLRVEYRPFDTFAAQRNHAIERLRFRHPWVLHLDADERLTPELADECRSIARLDPQDVDGWYIAPKMLWNGRWLPRCTDYPAYQARLVRVPRFRFVEVGHGQREARGMRMGYMKANYLHEMGAGGEEAWLEKHRRYARREAEQYLADQGSDLPVRSLFSSDTLERRRALKRLSHRLPLRPFARFTYQYFLRGGFLDGAMALRYCRLLARYEAFISREIRTLKQPPAAVEARLE